jgi:hypothetical protein
MTLRVLVADDNEVVRASIVRVLKENPDVEVVGQSVTYAQTMGHRSFRSDPAASLFVPIGTVVVGLDHSDRVDRRRRKLGSRA